MPSGRKESSLRLLEQRRSEPYDDSVACTGGVARTGGGDYCSGTVGGQKFKQNQKQSLP